jgi:hypothetical protein
MWCEEKMSRILWKGLLLSPAVLAASLVVSSTALAAEQPVEIAAAAQANLQLAGAATEAAKPETAKPETAEPASLASNLTVETIEKESANLYEGFPSLTSRLPQLPNRQKHRPTQLQQI